MAQLPRIISVDDHVLEPPNLWTDRLPKRLVDRGPRVERDRASLQWQEGNLRFDRGADDGVWCDFWMYQGVSMGLAKLLAAVDFDLVDNTPTTYDDVSPGCWVQADRLAAMDADHVDASVCFPNTIPRFCGQTFLEQPDKELGLACVRAYNDWIVEEWCAGAGAGRLIPVSIVPLWDVDLAVQELQRCADRGSFALSFSENPAMLGLPSIHTGYWDPLFHACADTGTTLCMHIGSSSTFFSTSPDAPQIISATTTYVNVMGSMLDFVFSKVLERVPLLKVMYSEGQVGWMPYVLERADKLWMKRDTETAASGFGSDLKQPPSSYVEGRVYGCIIDDEVGLKQRDVIGMEHICFETDYPHADATYPHSQEVAADLCARAGLDDEEIYKFLRGNAIQAFGLERFGLER